MKDGVKYEVYEYFFASNITKLYLNSIKLYFFISIIKEEYYFWMINRRILNKKLGGSIMKLKGIVKVAVFSVIGFVLTMGLGFLTGTFGMIPSLYLSSALPTIIVAPVFVIMCKQVAERGTAFLYFLLIGVFYVLMGMWPVIAICAIAGILAELVIGKKENYVEKNMKVGVAFGTGMFIYSLHAMYFTFVFGVEGLTKQFPKMFTTDYATFLNNFYTLKNIVICLLIAVIASVVGAYFGTYIYNKFFSDRKKKSVL